MDHLRQVFCTLQVEKFYADPKKCAFYTDNVVFLGFIVSFKGVFADPEKVKAITEWPQPQTIKEVRSFHGSASFYRWFIKNFSANMTPITDYVKSEGFWWTPVATGAFTEIKRMMTEAPVMPLPDFF